MSVPALAHIEALILAGGQIMLGTVAPISGAAVAHDGQKTLVMLRHRRGESIPALLARLDGAILAAQASGERVDEINPPSATTRYEL